MTHNLETFFVLIAQDENKALEVLKKEERGVDNPTVDKTELTN